MKTIFKYHLPLNDFSEVVLPKGAEIISVGNQEGKLQLWAIVDQDQTEMLTSVFRILGTGHPLELDEFTRDKMKFIGTVHGEMCLIWHVFELIDN